MEAFSLLRYWRTTTNAAGTNTTTNADVSTSTTTIITTQSSETDDDNDHGPFFDLEFNFPAEEEEEDDDDDAVDVKQAAAENKVLKNAEAENSDEEEDVDGSDESGDEEEDESELKFTLIDSDSSGDVNVSVSPSDELFFNGGFVPVEQQQTAEIRSKPFHSQSQSQSQPRVLLMKSATKFRVMMLKLKKIKSTETTDSNCSSSKEDAPIVSLFKRHNSSKALKKRENDVVEPVSVSSEEKKFSKEAVHKYLRKVKPLYVRVSNRYSEKLKFTGQLKKSKSEVTEKESKSEVSEPPVLKQGNLPAGLRVVCKHLRKSRSAFTAVAAAPSGAVPSNRRDDSLIQQQDGIQSAILHCKRSFKASRDSDCSSSSGSDPVPLLLGKSENSCDAAEGTAEISKR
ncbi:putative membrane-associated kinase regulator [Helianthus anomalus]